MLPGDKKFFLSNKGTNKLFSYMNIELKNVNLLQGK